MQSQRSHCPNSSYLQLHVRRDGQVKRPSRFRWPVQVISTARTCNLIFIVLDCLKPITHKKLIEHELEGFGIRLNKKPPAITFRRKEKGGINMSTTVTNPKLDLDSACSCHTFLLPNNRCPSINQQRTTYPHNIVS